MLLLYILLLVLFVFLSLKIYVKVNITWNNSYICLIGKTAIVTGANTGIGYWIALDLAKRGARVILACRDKNSAEAAKIKITKLTNNPYVSVKFLDLASLDSVRRFAHHVNQSEENVHILVNNAGAAGLENKLSNHGLQLSMQVNHFAVHLLTNLLLDKLKASAPSRIINTTSGLAKYAVIDPKALNLHSSGGTVFSIAQLYSKTKLCNLLFTIELSKRLKGTNVTVNCADPGPVHTRIYKNMPSLVQAVYTTISILCFKTAEEGAQTSIYLAVSNEVDDVSGCLFEECKQKLIFDLIKSISSSEVWEETEDLLKLT